MEYAYNGSLTWETKNQWTKIFPNTSQEVLLPREFQINPTQSFFIAITEFFYFLFIFFGIFGIFSSLLSIANL